MDLGSLKQWIRENAGPSLKLRMFAQDGSAGGSDIDAIAKQAAKEPVVAGALGNFLNFKAAELGPKSLEHLIHYYQGTCIDRFFPIVMDAGLRSPMKVFDARFSHVEKVLGRMQKIGEGYAYIYSCMLLRFFYLSGYKSALADELIEKRIMKLHANAKSRAFDLYRRDGNLPKPPERWKSRGVLKECADPFSEKAESPLPTVYDLSAMIYYRRVVRNAGVKGMIETIIRYIMSDEFQSLPEHYGLIWNKERRIYHACGWAPVFPPLEKEDGAPHFGAFNALFMLSKLGKSLAGPWSKRAYQHFRRYRDAEGVFSLPKEYLNADNLAPGGTSDFLSIGKNMQALYLSGENMKLGLKARNKLQLELVSSLDMLEIAENLAKDDA